MEKIKIGIAPIGWSNDDLIQLGGKNTFEQCISEMALAKYEGSEVGNKYPRDPKVLHEYLKIRNLEICNAWFSTFLLTKTYEEVEKDFIEHVEFLNAMGAKVVGVSEQGNSIQGQNIGIIKNKPIYTKEQWEIVISGLNKLHEVAKKYDIELCVHHHMGTGIETVEEIEYLMDNSNVSLLFDTGHLYFTTKSQKDVEYIFNKYFSRIVHIHLKDIREDVLKSVYSNDISFLDAVKDGVFTIPGDGVISFDFLFEKIKKEYSGWVVVEAEQDPSKANPFVYALKAREFIKIKLGR